MKITSYLALLFAGTSFSQAVVTLVDEDFSYADGSLIGNGTWANHSGTSGDLLVSGGAAVVQHGTPSEDANILYATQSSGVLTATFDLTVIDDGAFGTGTDYEYFAHFMTRGSFNFRSRVDIQAPNGAGDYTIGISSTSSTAEATLTADFAFDEVVSVTVTFDLDTGLGGLTVGAETISGTSTSLGETFDAFGLRQSDSTNNEGLIIDNLVITSSLPEPSTTLFGGLGLLCLLRRRR